MMQTAQSIYVVGDIHGQLKKLVNLLREAALLGANLSWQGGNTILLFVGDLVDRGPDSIAVMDLVLRLQSEAAAANGQVVSLLGNHELLMLAAYRFGRRSTGLGSNFITRWRQNGGDRKDLARLQHHHLEWLAGLPAMVRYDDYLCMHADAALYLRYGRSITEVNTTIAGLLKKSDALAWEELLEQFARRGAFTYKDSGEELARRFLNIYGGHYIVHGHTPISTMTRARAKHITQSLIYANSLCINVDGGMFLGGPGFLHQLVSSDAPAVSDSYAERIEPESPAQ